MNILVVANMYPSESDPVYGTFVKNFTDSVRARNLGGRTDICTICGRRSGKMAKLKAYSAYYLRLAAKLLFSRYDLVYVHTITFPTPVLRLASFFRRLPLVFNVHGGDVLTSNRLKLMLRNMCRPLLDKACMIVVPSEYFRKVLEQEFPNLDSAKIACSPSGGISDKFYSPVKNRPMAGRQTVLGFVSRIDSGKGWELFVDLIARLRSEGVDCKGIMAGRGEQTELLRRYISASPAAQYIEYIGPKTPDELPALYASMDLFIFPSQLSESLGLVGIEAMASGTPVIAADMAGPKTYITDGVNGYLFEPGNIDSLTACARCYLSLTDSEREAMCRAAFEHSLEYELEKVADDLYSRIQNCIKHPLNPESGW